MSTFITQSGFWYSGRRNDVCAERPLQRCCTGFGRPSDFRVAEAADYFGTLPEHWVQGKTGRTVAAVK